MKQFITVFILCLVTEGCSFLGIGKQCYTCTTTASTAGVSNTSTKEICGADEMKTYNAANNGYRNGVTLSTKCVEK